MSKVFPPKPEARFLDKELRVTLSRAVSGFWDGGPKSRFDFSIQIETGGYERHPNLPWHIKVGSWGANFWFRVPPAADPLKAARSALRRQLGRRARELQAQIEVITL